MKNYYLKLWWLISVTSLAPLALATDYNDGIPPNNDFKWMNLNLMYAYKELPRPKNAPNDGHDYLELEFGGRSGILDIYGYVDVFNLTNRDSSDKKGQPKMFMKFAPRLSLKGLFNNLPWGPVTDIYLATLFNWGGGGATNYDESDVGVPSEDTNNSFWGVGSDIQVPWFGKMGLNLYGLYDLNKKDWNGLQVSTNWFTPFYTFTNGSFISYQGYIDYQFGAKDTFAGKPQAKHGGAMFNGLYWHFDKFALGYGLKLYSDIYLVKNNVNGMKSSGASHYFAVTYKF
ncbi:outer membrane protein OmpK [Endozoicomonas atrinae]|uniref:nucleoside-specific channel-forming Tsx family protein n=1 Tax=Endozoicomonas atrinae TaxID=1333660 RepID=UPI0009F54A18|nr:outer membrane protein OmpK [Endozoicomonas atrinae]